MSNKTSQTKCPMTVALYVEGMAFHGDTLKEKSLGGSETAAISMAREMASRGHYVFMFCNTDKPGVYDNVIYRHLNEYMSFITHADIDVNISQRQISPFTLVNKAKINILWCHDLFLKRNRQNISMLGWNIDEIWVLSDFHKKQGMDIQGLPKESFWQTRNAIDAIKLDEKFERPPKRLVFAARPERGLDVLLNVMDYVWEKDPDVELGVCSYDNNVPQLQEMYNALSNRINEYRRQGRKIQNLGHLRKEDLYKVYQQTTLYSYPGNFEETFCITADECMANGLPLIGNKIGALPETMHPDAGILLNQKDYPELKALEDNKDALDFLDPEVQRKFAEVVLDTLNDPDKIKAMSEAGIKAIKDRKVTWASVAGEWESHLLDMFEVRSSNRTALGKELIRKHDLITLKALHPEKLKDMLPPSEKMSIVIPTIRSQQDVNKVVSCLKKASSVKHEYIIIANGVKIKPINALEGAKIISFDENVGVTKAWNAGVKEATKDHICIANDDAFVFKGWDKQLLELMRDKGLYAISPTEHCRAAPDVIEPGEMEGCFHIIKREVFDRLGLFDEDYFLVYSDTDMKEKMRASNMMYAIARDVFVWHQRSMSRRFKGADFDNTWEYKDRKVFEDKYKDKPDILKRHPWPTDEEEIAKIQERKHSFYEILDQVPIYGLQMLDRPEDLIEIVERVTKKEAEIRFQIHFGKHELFYKRGSLTLGDVLSLFKNKKELNIRTIPSGTKVDNENSGLYEVRYINAGGKKHTGSLDMKRKLLLQSPKQTVSACMIIKNGEDMLHGVLKKIKPYVDEIIVVDTGSTDSTVAIAEQHGCKIINGPSPLEVGFDAVRNISIEQARCDWILWIDADEFLYGGEELYKYLRPSIMNGFAISQHNISVQPKVFNNNVPDKPLRLFRNHRDVQFYGKVHEHPEDEIGKSIQPASMISDIDIQHNGFPTEKIRREKFARNWPNQEAGEGDGRPLTKFLKLRDLVHKARYAFEKKQYVECKAYATEAVDLYNKDFLANTGEHGLNGMMWYAEALRMLGRDKIKTNIVDSALNDLRAVCPEFCFEKPEDIAKFVGAQVERRMEPYKGKYV